MGIKKDKQAAVASELRAIADANGGRVDVDAVIKRARRSDSAMHDLFNWDIKQAALEHWRDTARSIVRTVKIEFTTHTRHVVAVAYVRDPAADPGESGYRSVESIRENDEWKHTALTNEFIRVRAALTRARSLASAFELESEIDGLVAEITRVQVLLGPLPPESRVQ